MRSFRGVVQSYLTPVVGDNTASLPIAELTLLVKGGGLTTPLSTSGSSIVYGFSDVFVTSECVVSVCFSYEVNV